jgi:hypothetical protein
MAIRRSIENAVDDERPLGDLYCAYIGLSGLIDHPSKLVAELLSVHAPIDKPLRVMQAQPVAWLGSLVAQQRGAPRFRVKVRCGPSVRRVAP